MENQISENDDYYVQDVDFISGVVLNQTPIIMAVAAAMKGFVPPRVQDRFTYCDLGCGDGTTVCALASVNPEARFYGVDFNAHHIDKAKTTAEELGLENIAFVQAGFEELENHELPEMDLVAMNGIYAWLESRPLHGVWEFLKSRLRTGGLFYVEYTTLPGMAAVPPLWKLIQTLVPAKGLSSRERAEKGLAMLQMLAKRGMGYLAANPRAAQAARFYVAGAKNAPERVDHFLHNAMASGFKPRYFQEMAVEMQACGLQYAGRTQLGLNVLDLSIPPGQIPTFRDITDTVTRETLTDYIRNEQCRRDVFIKEAPKDEAGARRFLLETLRLMGRNAPENMQRAIPVMGQHKAGLRGALFDFLFQAFEVEPKAVSQTGCPESSMERLSGALEKLIGSNQFFLCLDRASVKAEPLGDHPRMPASVNRWLLARSAREMRGVNLVSPLTGGVAMNFSVLEVQLLDQALERGFPDCVDAVLERLSGEDKMLATGRGQIKASSIKKQDLEKLLEIIRGRKCTNMLKLGILENAD